MLTGLYDVHEEGVIYCMPLELTVSLRHSLLERISVRSWYNNNISKEDRLKITVKNVKFIEDNNGFKLILFPKIKQTNAS